MKTLNHYSLKSYLFMKEYLPYLVVAGLVLFIISGVSNAADGTNYLSGVESSVSASFGEGSTFEHLLYLGEACVGAFGYIKTKNIMLLVGVVVLMIFTHFFFASAMAG